MSLIVLVGSIYLQLQYMSFSSEHAGAGDPNLGGTHDPHSQIRPYGPAGGTKMWPEEIRYATSGFNDTSYLDEGAMWPVAYALKELTAADEAGIAALVRKAVS